MRPRRPFRQRAAAALADQRAVRVRRAAALCKLESRAAVLRQLRDAPALRELAARIKQHTLDNLPHYLEQFADRLEGRGGRLHLAPDARAARRIICDIATAAGARLAVKAKSMTSEEIRLNQALEAAGVRTVETDLGEFILQIDQERPSHIVTPIIHKDRRQIARALQRQTGCDYTEDPAELTMIARRHLRGLFRRCDLGISGANFAVAETATLCVCTNEGNGRLTVTRPRVHVALLGIEKLVPRLRDLAVFLKLLARSSTGQPLTVYTTLINGPRGAADPDGPAELHVVLLDNGRSGLLGSEFAPLLRCIRCGACLNACPVYRHIGGHAYGSVYPGPIGSLLSPLLQRLSEHAELPRASSLCGACAIVCPVKIDIPGLLVRLRARTRGLQPGAKRAALRLWKWLMSSAGRYRWAQRWLPRLLVGRQGWAARGPGPLAAWTRWRDLPLPPRQSFRRLWRQRLRDEA